jgi:archaemetzincin
MGNFSATQRKILRLVADYMQAFYNLPIELKPEMKLEKVPPEMERKNPYEGQRQIQTHYFLGELLPKMLPADAAALVCFTTGDLYPGGDWNYVFGQASLQDRIGVWSLYRFGNPDKSPEEFKKFLARTLKVAMHETGHMFSMRHCAKYEYLMSGTNHLGETDRRPLDTCPECMAKIAWAMNYEPVQRYRNLAAFWEKQNRNDEKELFLKKAEALQEASKP